MLIWNFVKKQQNSKWADSFLVQQTFFFVFLCESYVCLSCAWLKRYFFTHFQMFLIFLTMRTHTQACIRWSKYTTDDYIKILEYIFTTYKKVDQSYENFFSCFVLSFKDYRQYLLSNQRITIDPIRTLGVQHVYQSNSCDNIDPNWINLS